MQELVFWSSIGLAVFSYLCMGAVGRMSSEAKDSIYRSAKIVQQCQYFAKEAQATIAMLTSRIRKADATAIVRAAEIDKLIEELNSSNERVAALEDKLRAARTKSH